jgi:DNA-binding transcriptional regulator YiaG
MMRAAAKLARPEWATRVEKLRERLQLTQMELARLLDVSAMAISRWERGINEPPAAAHIRLGKLAGSPDCWFFWERAGLSKSDIKRVLDSH